MTNLAAQNKLDSLAKCLLRLEGKRPASLDALRADPDVQDLLVLNLERAVQICVDLAALAIAEHSLPPAPTMAESFTALERAGKIPAALADRMRKAVGFRNLAVHEYEKSDFAIVFSIATTRLVDFKEFGKIMGMIFAQA